MTKYWRFKEPLEGDDARGGLVELRIPYTDAPFFYFNESLLEEVQAPLSEEPPEGAVVLDKDGDVWQRDGDHWDNISGAECRWESLQYYAPLTLMIREPSLEALEYWLRRVAPGSSDAARSLLAYLKADR